jgi:hypothetical protein
MTEELEPSSTMVWTFARGHQRLEVRRQETAGGPMLLVSGGDAPGVTGFADMAALVQHQTRLEAMLLDGGWSFVAFEPERRRDADRRATKRNSPDRRRRWSEGPAETHDI